MIELILGFLIAGALGARGAGLVVAGLALGVVLLLRVVPVVGPVAVLVAVVHGAAVNEAGSGEADPPPPAVLEVRWVGAGAAVGNAADGARGKMSGMDRHWDDQLDLRTPAQRRRDRLTVPFREALSWLRWCSQGRPVDEPVVISRGQLLEHRDGSRSITGWHWDSRRQAVPIDAEDLWVRYSVRYGTERC